MIGGPVCLGRAGRSLQSKKPQETSSRLTQSRVILIAQPPTLGGLKRLEPNEPQHVVDQGGECRHEEVEEEWSVRDWDRVKSGADRTDRRVVSGLETLVTSVLEGEDEGQESMMR